MNNLPKFTLISNNGNEKFSFKYEEKIRLNL